MAEASLVSVVPWTQPLEHGAAMGPLTSGIVLVRSHRHDPDLARKVVGRLRPPDRNVARALGRIHAATPIDVIVSARVPFPRRGPLRRIPLVVDLTDALAGALGERQRFERLPERLLVRAKQIETQDLEARLLRLADLALVASERDRAILARDHQRLPVMAVLPNGVDPETWTRRSASLGRDTIVFAGAMTYAPNHDAAMHLLQDVLPRIRQRRPDVRVRIIGRDPHPSLLAEAARWGPQVEVTGYVDDMRAALESASLALVPMRFGSGIQNKVLEAMALGIPVVTTSVAAAGLRLAGDAPPPIDVADASAELARATVARLGQVDADPSPNVAGREWVLARFSWDDIGDRLAATLVALAAST